MDENWIEAVLLKAERERSVMKVIDVKFDSFVPKGDNYLSQILRGTLTVMLGSGRKKKISVIIKRELRDCSSEMMNCLSAFKCETKMYQEVLQPMEALMDEFGDQRSKLWCKMLGYNAYDTIVLEDLTRENFIVPDRKDCLDLNHGLLSFLCLGRFHAMTKILMQRGLVAKTDFDPYVIASGSTLIKCLYEGGLKQLSLTIASSWPEEWKYLAEKIDSQVRVVCGKLTQLVEATDEKFLVVNHGDIWACNMLFRYSEHDNRPVDVRFIDFQISHVNSFAWDIVFLAYISIIRPVRRQNMDEFLRVYHDSFSKTLEFYGYTGIVPTLEEARLEVERIHYFALLATTIDYPLTCLTDFVEYDGAAGDLPPYIQQIYNPHAWNSQKIINELSSDIVYFIEKGVL